MLVPPASLRMYGGVLIRFGLHSGSKWRLPRIWKYPCSPSQISSSQCQQWPWRFTFRKLTTWRATTWYKILLRWRVIKGQIKFYFSEIIVIIIKTCANLTAALRQSSGAWPPRCSSLVFTIQINLCPSHARGAQSTMCSRPCCCVRVCVSTLRQKMTICNSQGSSRWLEKTREEVGRKGGVKKEEGEDVIREVVTEIWLWCWNVLLVVLLEDCN